MGSLNDVWTSPDGCQWEALPAAAWSARGGHGAAVKEGAIYVVGGADKTQHLMKFMRDVWRSDDAGKTWSLVTPTTSPDSQHWTGRRQHGVAVHIIPQSRFDGDHQCSSDRKYGDSDYLTDGGDSGRQRLSQLVVAGGQGETGYLSDVCKCGGDSGGVWERTGSSCEVYRILLLWMA